MNEVAIRFERNLIGTGYLWYHIPPAPLSQGGKNRVQSIYYPLHMHTDPEVPPAVVKASNLLTRN